MFLKLVKLSTFEIYYRISPNELCTLKRVFRDRNVFGNSERPSCLTGNKRKPRLINLYALACILVVNQESPQTRLRQPQH